MALASVARVTCTQAIGRTIRVGEVLCTVVGVRARLVGHACARRAALRGTWVRALRASGSETARERRSGGGDDEALFAACWCISLFAAVGYGFFFDLSGDRLAHTFLSRTILRSLDTPCLEYQGSDVILIVSWATRFSSGHRPRSAASWAAAAMAPRAYQTRWSRRPPRPPASPPPPQSVGQS